MALPRLEIQNENHPYPPRKGDSEDCSQPYSEFGSSEISIYDSPDQHLGFNQKTHPTPTRKTERTGKAMKKPKAKFKVGQVVYWAARGNYYVITKVKIIDHDHGQKQVWYELEDELTDVYEGWLRPLTKREAGR